MNATQQPTEMDTHRTDHPGDADPASNREMTVTDIKAAYADYADWTHRLEPVDRLLTGRYRRARFGDVEGRVLDVACGTGTNFRYFPDGVDLVGVDVSPEMLANAEAQLADLGMDGTLHEMDAQDLDFPDDSFDAVVSALSTCTFPDRTAALREMERVCKPDGTIRLVEHGRSDLAPIAKYQEWRADSQYAKTGCRLTQEPREVLADAGLSVVDASTGLFGVVTTFEVDPSGGERE